MKLMKTFGSWLYSKVEVGIISCTARLEEVGNVTKGGLIMSMELLFAVSKLLMLELMVKGTVVED